MRALTPATLDQNGPIAASTDTNIERLVDGCLRPAPSECPDVEEKIPPKQIVCCPKGIEPRLLEQHNMPICRVF